jgi:hypothetical protein
VPCPSWITDTSTVLDVTAVLLAVATIVTALEFIALRGEFRRYGLFDPQVMYAGSSSVLTRHLTRVSYPRLAGVQLILPVLVVLCIALDVSPALPLVALAITTVLRTSLLRYGGEGADHMAQVVTTSAAIAFAFSGNNAVGEIALVFIAAQLSLAYGASGVAKLFGRAWRSGAAVGGVLHTAFGHAGIVRSSLDRWPAAGRLLSWAVIGLEVLFPVGILLGGWVALGALAAIATLQLTIAVLMGLNRFALWFFAAFPATVWTACHYGVLSP